MRTLQEWLSHIYALHPKHIEFGLTRIQQVAERLSLTKFSVPVITIGGTNGKGSTAKTLASIYQTAGYKTALYTSPHILHFNERICINHHAVDDAALCNAFDVIEKTRGDISLSFFEYTTLAALYLFQLAKPDVIILEVGLGGRLDAVNCVDSDVAVVTSIALDHEQYLGNTREAIAYEKASIARAGKPFICGDPDPPKTLFETVSQCGAQLQFFSTIIKNDHWLFSMNDTHIVLPFTHLKIQNIACALAVMTTLLAVLPVSLDTAKQGIIETYWPGRFEHFHHPFHGILDVAHNPAATAWLCAQYQRLPKVAHTIGVVGMLKDKAMRDSVAALLSCIDEWIVCDLRQEDPERGADGSVIVQFLTEQDKNCTIFNTTDAAMQFVANRHCQHHCDRVLIFGSFVMVAAAQRWLAAFKH